MLIGTWGMFKIDSVLKFKRWDIEIYAQKIAGSF